MGNEIDFEVLKKQLKYFRDTIREYIDDKGIEEIWKEVFGD